MSLNLFDTHCHLDLPPIIGQLDLLLEEARNAGVSAWVVPGLEPSGWELIASLSDCKSIFPAFGIHPAYLENADYRTLELLDSMAANAVAIGETGLDKSAPDTEKQEFFFREQIRIARSHCIPILIHAVGRTGRTLEILKQEKACEIGGIMHAFSGSHESAREFIDLDFAISFSGAVTRPNAKRLLHLAASLPLSSVLVETDAPDMLPASRRGSFNRPAWLKETVAAIAEARCMDISELADATSCNALRYLRLQGR